jgi:hypothetical protein
MVCLCLGRDVKLMDVESNEVIELMGSGSSMLGSIMSMARFQSAATTLMTPLKSKHILYTKDSTFCNGTAACIVI